MAKIILALITFAFVNAFADHHDEHAKPHPNHKRRIAQGTKSGTLTKEEIRALKDEKKAAKEKKKDARGETPIPQAENAKLEPQKPKKLPKHDGEKVEKDQSGTTADHIKKQDKELEEDPMDEPAE